MSEFSNFDFKAINWHELKDFNKVFVSLWLLASQFSIAEFVSFVQTQSVFTIIKNVIFYFILTKYLTKAIRYIYGYGLFFSIKQAYKTIARAVFQFVLSLPPLKKKVDAEVSKVVVQIEEDLIQRDPDLNHFHTLPKQGLSDAEIAKEFERYESLKHNDWQGGKITGAVYHGGKELIHLQAQAFEKYCVSNQLHPDAFPGLRKMESEIVSMCLDLFNAPEDTGCGTTSSGGTESLLLTCLAAKMYGKKFKGITEPEIIAPESIHAGVDKACYYFNIKLHKVPLDKDYKADLRYVKRLINGNTVLLTGSAPNFPHGIVDDIEGLSKLAVKYNIPLHVDCCLGSFIVSYMERAGLAQKLANFPKFDFRLPGVTSISCDTHKYGFAPKGSSIIMYRNPVLRACQYYITTEWCGGLYGSPTLSGSRPGALMAGCWATMVKLGDEGYKQTCRDIVGAAQYFKKQLIANFPELQVVGDPILSVIAFKSDSVDVYDLNDALGKKGWHLSALQSPPALHIAFTVLSARIVDKLVNDLREVVDEMKAKGSKAATGDTAQVYGTAGSVSTTGVVDRLIEGFIDTLYKV